jgi:hypothetical protein
MATQMNRAHRRAIDDPGLRELSEDALGALERLAGAHELQAPRAWERLRVLIGDERQRRTGRTQVRLAPEGARLGGSKQFEFPISAMKSAENERAFKSIELAWRELRQAALQYTTNGAQARALCRVLERLGHDQAPPQVAKEPNADAH